MPYTYILYSTKPDKYYFSACTDKFLRQPDHSKRFKKKRFFVSMDFISVTVNKQIFQNLIFKLRKILWNYTGGKNICSTRKRDVLQ